MTVVYAALLGIIQGLTEFLPVSSSAHLILARAVFGWDADAAFGLAFDVACHVGTLVAVLWYFRRDLGWMARSALARSADPATRLLGLIVAGTVPVVFVGLLFSDDIEARTRTPAVAAAALASGAFALLAAERLGARARSEQTLTVAEAVLLGVAQAAALVPGVSRSGATIAVAMFAGLDRAPAARFTFLLGIPAILAAAGKEGLELAARGLDATAARLFAIGMVTSAVVGYLTVKYFIRYLARHSLDPFAYYRLVLAALAAGWLLA